MKALIFLIVTICYSLNLSSTPLHPHDHWPDKKIRDTEKQNFDPTLKPFYHGVASGDPTQNSVILWTRVTPDNAGEVNVTWHIYNDILLTDKVNWGTARTDETKDYTVKINAEGLEPNATYYYAFEYNGDWSLTGRTRTLPENADEVKLAVISCVNYQWGYFNALERISERNDLNAVIHMGDYFYEYPPGDFSHPDMLDERQHEPESETYKLADYRIRFSQYRLDPMLRKLHQQHPMIAVWDDHESTNNSWSTGASNHSPSEGAWIERKDFSAKAYDEWMPISNKRRNTEIYRSFDFGGLVDLYMLETRLSARDEPVGNNQQGGGEAIDTLDWQSEDRTMLGESQKDWLIDGLTGSDAKWKIIGSSIMMTHLPVNFLLNYDAWDGYPAERQEIFDALRANNIQNVGVFSGDVHMSFAANLMDDDSDRIEAYDSIGGVGSIGFEFTTPSVTSSNLNELPEITLPFFGTINPLGDRLEERSELAVLIEGIVRSSVPWVNHYNSDQHGYYLFYANDDYVQGDWMYVGSVLEQNSQESLGRSLRVNSGNNTLITVNQPIPTLNETEPAPETITVSVENEEDESAIVIGTYPNPAKGTTYLNLALNGNNNVSVEINDLAGRKLNTIDYGQQSAGNISLPVDIDGYPNGNYILWVIIGDKVYSRRISIQN